MGENNHPSYCECKPCVDKANRLYEMKLKIFTSCIYEGKKVKIRYWNHDNGKTVETERIIKVYSVTEMGFEFYINGIMQHGDLRYVIWEELLDCELVVGE